MPEIRRGGQDAGKLVHRLGSPVAVGTELTVAPGEKVAFVLDGSTVGVLEGGRYTLDPRSLPFLEICVQGGQIAAEIVFVADTLNNIRFGGVLRTLYDPQTGNPYVPRCFGSFTLRVANLRRLLVMGLLDQADQGEGWVKAAIIDALSRVLSRSGATMIDPSEPAVLAGLAEHARAELAAKLEEHGLLLDALSLAGLQLAPADQ